MKTITIIMLGLILAGCAQHKVVQTHQSGDRLLSCKEINRQIILTEDILDGIKHDKENVTSDEVWNVIGFGLIGYGFDQHNTNKAQEAASERLKRLEALKANNNC